MNGGKKPNTTPPNKKKHNTHTQDPSLLGCLMLHFLCPQLSITALPHPAPELAFHQVHPLNKYKTYIRRKHFQGWESFLACMFSYRQHLGGLSHSPPLFLPFLKGTTGMLKYELGLFYIKIKMHLKILLVSTKQVITGQVIKIKFTQKSNFGG